MTTLTTSESAATARSFIDRLDMLPTVFDDKLPDLAVSFITGLSGVISVQVASRAGDWHHRCAIVDMLARACDIEHVRTFVSEGYEFYQRREGGWDFYAARHIEEVEETESNEE